MKLKQKGHQSVQILNLHPRVLSFFNLNIYMTLTFSSEQLKAHKEGKGEVFAKMSIIFNTKEGDVIN